MKALRVNETLRESAAPLASKTLFSKPGRLENHDFHDLFDFGHLGHPRLAAIPDVDLGLQVRYRPETITKRSGILRSMPEKYAERKRIYRSREN